MLQRFDYRLIRQFLLFAVVAEEKSIRRAAKRLAISQTPLAAQLDELEVRLKIKLTERGPKGVELTPAGLAVLPQVQRFIAQAEVLNYMIKEIRENHTAAITVAAVGEAMLGFLPELKKAVGRSNPGITVFSKEINSADAAEEIASKTSAVAIGHFRKLRHDDVQTQILLEEKPVAVMAASHPLAGRKSVRLEELAGEDWVFHARENAPQMFDDMIEASRAAGVTPNIRHLVEGAQRQIAYAACGQGIAMLPQFYVCALPPAVRAVEIEDLPPCIAMSAAWNPTVESPARDTVLAAARAVAQAQFWN